MSLRIPPDRLAARGRDHSDRGGLGGQTGGGRATPDEETFDVAPDEVIDGVDGVDGVDGEHSVDYARAADGVGGADGRASADPDGTNHAVATADAVERVGIAEEAAAPAAGPPLAAAVAVPGAVQPAAGEPDLREWLNRQWLFGLSYWQAILVGLLAIVLVLTRFVALDDRAMHHDESMHAKFAWDTFKGQVYKYNPLLHGPFQFLAVAFGFWLLGATEATARAVPAAFGVALVGLTFLWRRWLGTAGWLFALAIFVFSPSFTYFARMLREDSYTATWTLLAATGLVGYVIHRRRPWFYAFCAGLAFAFATKESTYITAFIWGAFMIYSLLWERATPLQRRVLAGAAAGAIVGAFWSSVMGHYKKELHEVGGALIGLGAGAALGLVYHRLRPVAAARTGGGAPAAGAPPPETRRPLPGVPPILPRRQRGRLDGRFANGAADGTVRTERAEGTHGAGRPEGTFTRALRTVWQDQAGFWGLGTLWGGVLVFFAIFVLLFSSFFTNPAGIREGMVGSIQYWLEQHGVQRGNQPWYYYLLLLGAYETLALVFGVVATIYYLRRPTWLTGFLIWWWLLALVIYSWAGEKMPWLVIHIATPLVLLAARYLGELATGPVAATATAARDLGGRLLAAPAAWRRSAWERRLAFAGVAVLGLWTIHTGWPVNFERPDTPKDLLVYTQTAPDVKKVLADIERMSLEQTGDARALGITVQSGTWWPFSWYLRDFKNADYPSQLSAQATKPIVLIALEDDEKNRPFLQGYTRTRYKMRWWYPEDYRTIPEQIQKSGGLLAYLARKDVRDGLWNWLIYRETTQPLGSYDFYVYIKEGLGPGGAAAAGTSGAEAAPAGSDPGQGQANVSRPGSAGGAAAPPRPNNEVYAAKTVPLSPIAQWGTQGRGAGQFNTPRAVTLDGQGNLYVADALNHRIQKLSRTGSLLAAWGTEGSGDGQFKEPMGVAVDKQGNVYVADTWNHRIQKFDASGKFLAKWVPPAPQGGFWGPRAIALDGEGNVYVTDTGNKRVLKFDGNGRLLAQIGTGGSGPGQLSEPIGLAVTPDGEVYVADTLNFRIQRFDAGGKAVAEWPVAGWQVGVRNEPYLALDAEGNVYATDPPNARVLKFSPTGDVLAVAGSLGKAAGQLDLPLGIAAGDALYVVDSANHRVQAFGLLQ